MKKRLFYPIMLSIILLAMNKNIQAPPGGVGGSGLGEAIAKVTVPPLTLASLGFSYLAHKSQSPILALMGLGALAGVGLFGAIYKEDIDNQARRERANFEKMQFGQEAKSRFVSVDSPADYTGTPTESKAVYRIGTGIAAASSLGMAYLARNQNAPAIKVMLGIASLGNLALTGFFGNELRRMISEEAKRIKEELEREEKALKTKGIISIKKAIQ